MTLSSRNHRVLQVLLPLSVLTACTILVLTPFFTLHADRLSTAVTLDLAITAPLLFWLAGGKPRIAVRVFVLGLLAAGLLLSGRTHPLLDQLRRWVSPVIEAGVLFLLVRGIYRSRKLPGAKKGDFLMQGRLILGRVLGSEKAGDVLISEFAVFYYLFAGSVRRESVFSYHRKNGIRAILYLFLFCIVAETIGVHFLVALASKPIAWVLTVLGVYTLLQVLAHCRAIGVRPIFIEGGTLYLRNGLVADVDVSLDNIAGIRVLSRPESGNVAREIAGAGAEAMRLGLLGAFETPNIRLDLYRSVTVYRPFGIRRTAKTLFFYADQAEALIAAVQPMGSSGTE